MQAEVQAADVPRLIALPKPWLDEQAYRGLNGSFYGAEPHDYFISRLQCLMVAAGNPGALFEAFKGGLEFGSLKMGGPGSTRDESPEAEAGHRAFLTADSVNLLHHLSETLLRFYFAHRPDAAGKYSPCPWLEIVNEVKPGAFKRLVRMRFDDKPLDDARRREVTSTFYGSPKPSDDETELARVAKSVDEIERWLQHFARYFTGEAQLYNSMKHGLAVRPGEAMMRLETPADAERIERGEKPLIHVEGSSVEYLARDGRDEPFKQVTRWVRPDILMAETQVGIHMLKSIWEVGKIRYVDGPAGKAKPTMVRFYDQMPLNRVLDAHLDGDDARLIIQTMSMDIGYLYAYPPVLKCTVCDRVPRDGEKRPRHRWRALADGSSPLQVVCPECAASHRASS